jgi:ComF family protein
MIFWRGAAKMDVKKILLWGLDLLFPPHCVFCSRTVAPGTRICRPCAEELASQSSFSRIGVSTAGSDIYCLTLYWYRDQVRDSIIRYKFQGEKRNAAFYADVLARQIVHWFPWRPDFVTSVPLSAERLKERGYNQSELLAEPVAEKLKIPYIQSLKKTGKNRVQHSLRRESRKKNVAGVYSLCGVKIAGKRILLIDDIVTTGSTLLECSNVLLNGGARDVICAAIARVPQECPPSSA